MNNPQQKVSNPGSTAGIALLVIGILSLLSSGYFAFSTANVLNNPEKLEMVKADMKERMESQREGLNEEEKKQVENMFAFFENSADMIRYFMYFSFAGIACALVTILGGVGLMNGSKGMGILGGLAAMFPSWCCVLGVPIGIWAIIASFKSGNTPKGNFQ